MLHSALALMIYTHLTIVYLLNTKPGARRRIASRFSSQLPLSLLRRLSPFLRDDFPLGSHCRPNSHSSTELAPFFYLNHHFIITTRPPHFLNQCLSLLFITFKTFLHEYYIISRPYLIPRPISVPAHSYIARVNSTQ